MRRLCGRPRSSRITSSDREGAAGRIQRKNRTASGLASAHPENYLYLIFQLKPNVTVALLVRLEAKPGKEAEVESFLRGGLSIVEAEPATTTWFAIRLGPSTFGIFDAFPDEAGRQAHLSGQVAAALKEKASELFAEPPKIEMVDVLAAKLPA
jgi:quinol monooxygenase YgiN